jgi:hypothetical protein
LQQLAGAEGARNIIGHKVVSADFTIDAAGDPDDPVQTYIDFKVSQSHDLVAAGLRAKREETFDSLRQYAQHLIPDSPDEFGFSCTFPSNLS